MCICCTARHEPVVSNFEAKVLAFLAIPAIFEDKKR